MTKTFQDGESELFGRYVTTQESHRLFDSVDESHHLVLFDRAVLAGALNATNNLFAIKGFPFTGALHDHEAHFFNSLKGGEATVAGCTLATAANSHTVFSET